MPKMNKYFMLIVLIINGSMAGKKKGQAGSKSELESIDQDNDNLLASNGNLKEAPHKNILHMNNAFNIDGSKLSDSDIFKPSNLDDEKQNEMNLIDQEIVLKLLKKQKDKNGEYNNSKNVESNPRSYYRSYDVWFFSGNRYICYFIRFPYLQTINGDIRLLCKLLSYTVWLNRVQTNTEDLVT